MGLLDWFKPSWDRDLFHVKPYPVYPIPSGAFTFVVGTTPILIAPENSQRRRVLIQNAGVTIIKLMLGYEEPTQTNFHVALPACTVANDGTGGTYIDEMWRGEIQAISSAPGGVVIVTLLA